MSGLDKEWTGLVLHWDSPGARARWYFWIKVAISIFYYAIWVAIIVKLEPWFQRHAFLSAIVAVLAVVTWGTFALAWHFNIPCPHCGFNINLPKDLWQGSPMVVPPCCPNCGADLTVGHPK